MGLVRASNSRLAESVFRAEEARFNPEIAELKACRLAFSKVKNNKTTKHVEACLETSRDGGSNPPASSLRPPLYGERRLLRHSGVSCEAEQIFSNQQRRTMPGQAICSVCNFKYAQEQWGNSF